MNYSTLRKYIANYSDKSWTDHTYAIGNEFGLIAIVYADNDQDALDAAADSGHMDCQLMSESDCAEYSANGWYNSFTCLGNACEPYWTEHLRMEQIK